MTSRLHVLDPGAWQLHRGILELDLRSPDVIHTRAEGRQRSNRGNFNRGLVRDTVPVLLRGDSLRWLRRRRRVIVHLLNLLDRLSLVGLRLLDMLSLGCRGLRRSLARDGVGVRVDRLLLLMLLLMLLLILHHVLLLGQLLLMLRTGGMKGVSGILCRSMGVKSSVRDSRAPARSREVGRAVLKGLVHALCLVRDVKRESLHRLPGNLVLRRHVLRVHRGDARVVVLCHVVRMLGHAGGPMHHANAGVLLWWLLGHRLAMELVGAA